MLVLLFFLLTMHLRFQKYFLLVLFFHNLTIRKSERLVPNWQNMMKR